MFQEKVQRYIYKEKLLAEDSRILVALSGGADSVALLRVLQSLGYACEAVHCNFRLRGEESDRDEAFVRALCERRNVLLHVTAFDTREYAAGHRLSIEMAARELRYAYFEELSVQRGIDAVAVAHHRDDSVETFLLNLIRGTGLNGLRGIRPKNGKIVRPLLAISREEILAYLASIGQEYVTDSTNLQDDYTRNKIRLNLLPLMETINPSVRSAIATLSGRIAEAEKLCERQTEQGKARVVSPYAEGGEGAFRISIPLLKEEPAPQSLLFEILHPAGFSPAQAEQIYEQLDGEPGRRFAGKGRTLVKDRSELLVVKSERTEPGSPVLVLPEKGTLRLDDNCRITVRILPWKASSVVPREKHTACLDVGKLAFPLTVRRWQQGDKFAPFGMKGMKKLSDYMTDRKFSLLRKQRQWVVCSGGRIAWVVGERCDNRFRIDARTTRVLWMKAEPENP